MFYGGDWSTMWCGRYSMFALHTMHNTFELKGHGGGFKLTSWNYGFNNIDVFSSIFCFEGLFVYEPKVDSFNIVIQHSQIGLLINNSTRFKSSMHVGFVSTNIHENLQCHNGFWEYIACKNYEMYANIYSVEAFLLH